MGMKYFYEYDQSEVLDILRRYITAVERLPNDVNPYGEMDNILDGRDIIEEHKQYLSQDDINRLNQADCHLRRYPKEVNQLLGRDPKRHRERNNIPRSHWWWYIDESTST
jgi:hypothetical protein